MSEKNRKKRPRPQRPLPLRWEFKPGIPTDDFFEGRPSDRAGTAANAENTMPVQKYVNPEEKVGLSLTTAERNTILKDVEFLDDDYEHVLRETQAGQAIEFTLSDWDYLGGEICFEAEEADDSICE